MTEGGNEKGKDGQNGKGKDQKNDEAKKNEGKVIMEARMHCESCRYKVYRAVIGYPGVEDIHLDMNSQKVTLKAPKVDAVKLFETAKKKSKGKIVKLLHPDPNAKKEDKKEDKKKDEKKPVDVTVVLKVQMHCGACTKKVEKAAWKIAAVYSVKVEGDKVTIKGTDLDPKKVCEEVIKKSGKHAEVIPPKKEDKKDGDNKANGGQKKDGEKKEGEKNEGGGDKKEGGGDKNNGGGGGGKDGAGGGDKKQEAKKEEKQPPMYVVEYVYAPQYFSDENPNACAIM